MGYTHYYYIKRDITTKEWDELVKVAKILFREVDREQDIKLCNFEGEEGTEPKANKKIIYFNGCGDDSCESFNLYRKPKNIVTMKRGDFRFCKTYGRPYDTVVCAFLILISRTVRRYIEFSSDGPINRKKALEYETLSWVDGLELANKVWYLYVYDYVKEMYSDNSISTEEKEKMAELERKGVNKIKFYRKESRRRFQKLLDSKKIVLNKYCIAADHELIEAQGLPITLDPSYVEPEITEEEREQLLIEPQNETFGAD